MKNYFVNPSDRRLRAGWRILAFVAMFMAFSLLGQALLKAYFGGIPKTTTFLRNSIVIIIAAIAATAAVPLARRFLDKKPFASLGLRLNSQSVKDFVFGLLLSGLMAALIFFIMKISGLIEVTAINWSGEASAESHLSSFASYLASVSLGSLMLLFLMDVIVGWWEELVFRGYLLQNMIEGLGHVIAVVVSCILYGLVHAANPNAGLLSTGIIMLFGFLRIYGYLSTKQLWLSMGMHIGWNFFQGPIFGFAASGNETATLIQQTPTGPDWLSGGAFGPEGSIIVIPIIGLALLMMRWWSKRTQEVKPSILNPADNSFSRIATQTNTD